MTSCTKGQRLVVVTPGRRGPIPEDRVTVRRVVRHKTWTSLWVVSDYGSGQMIRLEAFLAAGGEIRPEVA